MSLLKAPVLARIPLLTISASNLNSSFKSFFKKFGDDKGVSDIEKSIRQISAFSMRILAHDDKPSDDSSNASAKNL